jgi:hypothetical protein
MFVACQATSCHVYLYKHSDSNSAPSSPTPTVTLSANPTSITAGTSSVLVWNSTNASTCTASGGWSGTKPISGSQSTENMTANTTFTLTCTGTGGSASQSTTVTVTSSTTPPPSPTPPPSAGNPTLLVKFGKTSSLNTFGLSGWSTVIRDIYTDYQDLGPGGTTIVVGDNYAYNYQGVTGNARSFVSGDKIRVTWYNNSSTAVSFTPNISFTDPDRIIMGASGSWYPMSAVTVSSFGSATSEYAFTSATAGSYSLVNINVNYTNTRVIIADKIELVPNGSTTPATFDFSLTNGGSKSVIRGQSVSNTITANLVSGTTQPGGFSVSGLPSNATGTFSQGLCSPTCSTTLNISTLSTTPTGNHTISVTAVAGSSTKTTEFNLTVNTTTTPPPITPPPTGTLPLGTLVHDGPATPEQISLFLPVTGSLPQTATATVRYKPSNSSTWLSGHPLYRIRPTFSTSPDVGSVPDAFAWPIIDLAPGTSYDVEVTITNGATTDIKTASFTTRSLPPPAGTPNKTITAGSSVSQIQTAFNNLNPGDVIEFKNGTYNISNLQLNRSGTLNNPIYIRGESRSGVVLSNSGRIIQIQTSSNVIFESMTLQGSGADSGTNATSVAFEFQSPSTVTNITFRNLDITGVDRAIGPAVTGQFIASGLMVYNNTITGNNVWTSAFLSDNRTWNDDGINLAGQGNVAFNNTIKGFGDTFAYASHSGGSGLTQAIAVHYYRNDIRNSLDDLVEVDYGHRNITFYDNRAHNVSTCSSLDPLYGGPWLYARNICINPARVNLHKWNTSGSGQFLYNNTFISTVTAVGYDPDVSAWYQPQSGGAQQSYGYRNNLLVYRGNGNTLWLESTDHDPIDWTHNSWFPNRQIQWGGVFANLAAAQSGLANTSPIFSGTNRRMENDNVTVTNPWTTTVTLGANSISEVTATYTPELSGGTAPKNSGVVIPNITDGFSGAAPDRGAIIAGRLIPTYGDSNGLATTLPAAPTALTLH